MLRTITALLAAAIASATPAYAYVDPGAAILVLQGAIGVIAGLGLFFRRGIASMFGFLHKNKPAAREKSKQESESVR